MIVTKNMYIKGHPTEEFLSHLKEEKVHIVIDIRRSFYRRPEFYPKAFEKLLEPYGIEYIYERRLGNPFKVSEHPDMTENKKLYQEYVKTTQKDLLDKLKFYVKENPEENIALVCWCATNDSTQCHRYWLAELIEERK